MPVPFRDAQDIDELGTAAYLRLEREADRSKFRGALFVINARGEPLQFTYARATSEYSVLWRRTDIERHAARKLAEKLFASCPQAPRILLHLDSDVPREVFEEDLALTIAVCRVSGLARPLATLGVEPAMSGGSSDTFEVSWLPPHPHIESAEQRLFAELVRRNLVVDAFDRATRGLREVYPSGSAT